MPRLSADQRRADLVAATVRVAVAEGLEAATVRRVAQEAGVPLGTVHYCFGSKTALIEAVAESITQPVIDADAFDEMSPAEAVRASLRTYWEQIGSDRRRQLLVYELLASLSRGDADAQAVGRRLLQRAYSTALVSVDRYIAALDHPVAVDPAAISRLIVAVTDGVSLSWIVDNDDAAAWQTLELLGQVLAIALAALPADAVGPEPA
ncbi:TetR/AcrR family transcriptional regulator [Rudaeicoccus suwonensis]|uniref:TetR family transcriptional regulator n=1 Tax=Rudaeicoccus suwonensis TaxID=657409 RepID=A0A561E7H7_9MICO|nr:TetR/AcrR family transcriptional regulator [Rudaeicoccus suwonensis]TWE11559.1 TetR family transcriptional regulator [Rudaeicoccus suwonensis]